jgi:hypothetical protein
MQWWIWPGHKLFVFPGVMREQGFYEGLNQQLIEVAAT